jgi:hypothetical protein
MGEGKKTERTDMPKQLRTDSELAEDIRFIARMNRRQITEQVLVWIEEGVKEDKRRFSQAASGAEPIAVRSSQEASRKMA